MVMMWLREDSQDGSRSPETRLTSILLSPASEACSWAGSDILSVASTALSYVKQPTVVDTHIECGGDSKGEQPILLRILHGSYDEARQLAGADHPGPVLICSR
jgi:hypothetical protein